MSKILIYDDNQVWANQLKKNLEDIPVLKSEYEIAALSQEDFDTALKKIRERRQSVREGEEWKDDPISLDRASIFVIDYDLFDTHAFLTGEDIAYLVRCFSTCGLIVALNQYPRIDFDLTLKGHLESFADLNINGAHLSNPNLWGGEADGFYPWYWPSLPRFEQTFSNRVDDVRSNLKEPIWSVLGFEEDIFEILPRSISQFIGSDPVETTFEKFVKESGNGTRQNDAENANEEMLARVGAARISKWLERDILSELDILVDAPHLVIRYPSLIQGDQEKIEAWNMTTKRDSHTELGLDTEKIEPFRFKKQFWLSRPAWFWDGVRDCNDVLEVREPWETFQPDWVFCEDISRFYDGDDYRKFVANVESPFTRRYVKEIEDIKYQPRVRFSF